MRRFFRLGFFLVLLFLLTSLIPKSTFADFDSENTNCNDPWATISATLKVPAIPCQNTDSYTFDPPRITSDVPIVKVTFKNLHEIPDRKGLDDDEFMFCLKSNPYKCTKDDLRYTKDKQDGKPYGERVSNGDGTFELTFTVCGSGDTKLKTKCRIDGADWFYPGKTYTITLFERDNDPKSQIIASASFYVYRFYPIPKVELQGGLFSDIFSYLKGGTLANLNIDEINKKIKNSPNSPALTFNITLTGSTSRGRGDANIYNDYWISFDGYDTDYSTSKLNSHQCIYVKPPKNLSEKNSATGKGVIDVPATITLEDKSTQELTAGVYYIKIVDGKSGNFKEFPDTSCQENDFAYWYIPLTIAAGKDPKTGLPNKGNIGAPIRDPKGKELGVVTAVLPVEPPCTDSLKDKNGYCTGVFTAIGIIHTDPTSFIRDLFTIVLSVGGIASFAFFLRAGYTILTSAGNKEKVGQAREQITSAVTGLIFIILSIAILEFIGINILHIPGFK